MSTTIENISKVIIEQINYIKLTGGEISKTLINSLYDEITENAPKSQNVFTKYDHPKFTLYKVTKSANFQYLQTEKGVIITNKFF